MTRFKLKRRALLASGTGMAGILATGRAPAIAQTQPKKLVFAHINAAPESAAINFEWMAKEVNARSKGALDMQFFGKTLIPQEMEIMNAVKSGSIAIGSPSGAAATAFPEMGAFLVPYLVKDYAAAYAMFNGRIGDKLDKEIQDKYKLKVLCFYDFGFRHFWTNKKPIVEPRDLRGQKIRVQQAKVFGDTINGLGGNAVPMGWGEVITAAHCGTRSRGSRFSSFHCRSSPRKRGPRIGCPLPRAWAGHGLRSPAHQNVNPCPASSPPPRNSPSRR